MALFVFLGYLTACGFGSHSSRGSLSDAMEKASDDHKGERTVQKDDSDDEEDDYDHRNMLFMRSDSLSKERPDSANVETYWGISGGSGLISGDFNAINNVNLHYGIGSERVFAVFYGGYYWAPVNADSKTGKSIQSPLIMLKAGIELNYYTTPKWTFLGNRLIGGFNIGISQWNYRNAIYVDSNGSSEKISGDMLTQFELYIGTGLNVVQTKYFNMGFYVHPGILLFSDETNEGFENDFFDPEAYLRLGLILDLK